MADDPTPLTGAAEDRSLVEDVRQLVDDGRTLVEAELAYQKSRAVVAAEAARSVAGWTLAALALVFFAVMALVLGLVLALVPALGALGATLAVMAGLLLMGALSGVVAVRRWRRAAALLREPAANP